MNYRKIPQKKSYKEKLKARDKRENVGIITSILDKFNNVLVTGDIIKVKSYVGIFLFNRHQNAYGLFYGQWYGNNRFDPESYGKFIKIPLDNGMRMELEKIRGRCNNAF